MLKMADVPAGRREDFNEAQTVAGHVIVPGGVLLGVGDEQNSADILNVKWREAAGDAFSAAVVTVVITIAVGIESIFAEVLALEIGAINFDSRRTEIRDVKKFVAVE